MLKFIPGLDDKQLPEPMVAKFFVSILVSLGHNDLSGMLLHVNSLWPGDAIW